MNLTRYAKATSAAVLCLGTLLALPASGLAADAGGTAAAGSGGTVVPPAGSPALQAGQVALLGRRQKVVGQIGGGAGGGVLLQRSDPAAGWVTVARSQASADGAFTAIWKTDRSGRFTLRAASGGAGAASVATSAPTARRDRLPLGDRDRVRAQPQGDRADRLWRLTHAQDAGRRQPHAALRNPGGGLLPRPHALSASDRPRSLRQQRDWDLTYAAARAVRFNGLDHIGTVRTGRVSLARRR